MSPEKMSTREKMIPASRRVTTRLAASLPGGAAVLLLGAAVAFGGSFGTFSLLKTDASPKGDGTAASAKHDLPDSLATSTRADPTPKATPKPTQKPTPKETVKPAVKPTPEPTPELVAEVIPPAPAPKFIPAPPPPPPPSEKPVQTDFGLEAWAKETKVKLAWNPFWGDGFAYYKLVRSHDESVSWPTSGDDELIAAIGNREETYFADHSGCGTTLFYRVFAVRDGGSGYETMAASNTASAFVECPAPPPPPQALAFTVAQTESGMSLTWQPYTGEGFIYYKVVRSQTNADPLYPLNEGTELIGVIGDPNEVSFFDGNVASGQTWFYRVLAMADHGYGKWAAAQTPAVSVTVQ